MVLYEAQAITESDSNAADFASFDKAPAQSEFMAAHYVRANMKALALAEERGSWRTVATFLESALFKRVRQAADEVTLAAISGTEKRLLVARAYESLHGEGSLLNREHWFNIEYKVVIYGAAPPSAAPFQSS